MQLEWKGLRARRAVSYAVSGSSSQEEQQAPHTKLSHMENDKIVLPPLPWSVFAYTPPCSSNLQPITSHVPYIRIVGPDLELRARCYLEGRVTHAR